MTLHVLNGDEPDKITYFSKKDNFSYHIILHSMNKSEEDTLLSIMDTCEEDDKILISSESQLTVIRKNTKLNDWYKNNTNKFIGITFKNNKKEIDYLNNRETLLELPTLTKDYFISETDNNGKFNIDIQTKLNNGILISKNLITDGKTHTHFGTCIGDFDSDILEPNKKYLIQPLFDKTHYNFYRVPTYIKNGKIIECLPLTGQSFFNYCKAKWGSFKLNNTKIDIIECAINEIIDTYDIDNCIMEPEFAINFDDEIYLINLNIGWGYSTSITQAFTTIDEPCALIHSILFDVRMSKLIKNYSSETLYYGESYYRIRNDKDVRLIDTGWNE